MSSLERRRIILEEIADDPSTPARQRRDALAELADLDAAAGQPPFAEEVKAMPPDELVRDAAKLRRPIHAPEMAWKALTAATHLHDPDLSYRVNQLVNERVRAGIEAAVAERTRWLAGEAEAARTAETAARRELDQARGLFSQALAAGGGQALPPGTPPAAGAEEPGEGVPAPGRKALPPAGATEAGFPRRGERRIPFLEPYPSRGGLVRRG